MCLHAYTHIESAFLWLYFYGRMYLYSWGRGVLQASHYLAFSVGAELAEGFSPLSFERKQLLC